MKKSKVVMKFDPYSMLMINYGAPIGTLLYNIIIYFKLSIYAKLLVLWSVLQHELYVELKSYGQLYMYGYRSNFLVCPELVRLWSVSTRIYAKLKIHARLKFYGQLTLKSMVNSKFMLNFIFMA